MNVKEYFFGTETTRCIKSNMERVRKSSLEISTEIPSPYSDKDANRYVRLEMFLAKSVPNLASGVFLI